MLVRPFLPLFLLPEAQLVELKDQECPLRDKRRQGGSIPTGFRSGFKTEGSGTTNLLLISLSLLPRFSSSNNIRDCSRWSSMCRPKVNCRRRSEDNNSSNLCSLVNSSQFNRRSLQHNSLSNHRWLLSRRSWLSNNNHSNRWLWLSRSSNSSLLRCSSNNSKHCREAEGLGVAEAVEEDPAGPLLLHLQALPLLGLLGLVQLALQLALLLELLFR